MTNTAMLGESPTKSNKTFMKARQGKRFKLSIKSQQTNHYERTKPKSNVPIIFKTMFGPAFHAWVASFLVKNSKKFFRLTFCDRMYVYQSQEGETFMSRYLLSTTTIGTAYSNNNFSISEFRWTYRPCYAQWRGSRRHNHSNWVYNWKGKWT